MPTVILNREEDQTLYLYSMVLIVTIVDIVTVFLNVFQGVKITCLSLPFVLKGGRLNLLVILFIYLFEVAQAGLKLMTTLLDSPDISPTDNSGSFVFNI